MASALLAVTFPFLAFHADFFQMWPLAGTRKQDQDGERVAQHRLIATSNMGEST